MIERVASKRINIEAATNIDNHQSVVLEFMRSKKLSSNPYLYVTLLSTLVAKCFSFSSVYLKLSTLESILKQLFRRY